MHTSTTAFSRRRWARGLALGTMLTGLIASSVSAATTGVEATDDKLFTPSTVTSAVGSSVHWFGTPGSTTEHSVRQNAGLFDSGVPQPGLNYTRTFSAGTFAYHCEKHGLAMSGQVKVAPQVLSAPRGLPFTVKWATTTQTGNRFDVQYRVGAGAWKTWKRSTTARSAVFGARSAPVRVVRNKTYSFRVVSRLGTARSGLSPVKSFRAS